jgi:hypothetical protein
MRLLRGPWGLAAAVIVVGFGCGLIALSDKSGPATAAGHRSGGSAYPERPLSGLVAELPFVGALTWSCQEQKGAPLFAVQLEPPKATIYVSLTADGHRVWKRKRIDPLPNRREVWISPPALRSQTWTITHRHAPATIRITARLRFAASESQCVISRSTITTHRSPH